MECPLIFECDECGRDLEHECVQRYDGKYVVSVKTCEWCKEALLDDVYSDIKHVLDEDCYRKGRRF